MCSLHTTIQALKHGGGGPPFKTSAEGSNTSLYRPGDRLRDEELHPAALLVALGAPGCDVGVSSARGLLLSFLCAPLSLGCVL